MPIQNIDENNRARDRLIAQLRTSRLIGCTGAGVSVWAGYRSWKGVIARLAAEVDLRRNGEVNTQLVVQNYGADLLLCARRLGSDLGEPAFSDFISREFGPTGSPAHDVLVRIAALPLRHTLTLNFDLSFENAHLRTATVCHTITSGDRRAMARFLRDMDDPGYPKQAVHLHGKYDDPADQIALTETGYSRLYRNNDLFMHFLWSMATRRLFFLGFGFRDTDFGHVLQTCARDVCGNGLNHFALIGLKADEQDTQRRVLMNERYLVDPIFYNVQAGPDGSENHDGFVGIINGISAALGVAGQPPQAPVVVAGHAAPVTPADERRAEELNRRLLERIERGGGGV